MLRWSAPCDFLQRRYAPPFSLIMNHCLRCCILCRRPDVWQLLTFWPYCLWPDNLLHLDPDCRIQRLRDATGLQALRNRGDTFVGLKSWRYSSLSTLLTVFVADIPWVPECRQGPKDACEGAPLLQEDLRCHHHTLVRSDRYGCIKLGCGEPNMESDQRLVQGARLHIFA